MRYVLDASVAVASLRPNEPFHAASVAYLTPLMKGLDAILVPSIFRIEVASALARSGFTLAQVSRSARNRRCYGNARLVFGATPR